MEVPRGVEPTGTNGRTRHTFRPACWVGSRPVVVSFVGWQGALFLVVTETIPVKRFVRVRCPVPGPPRSESWRGSGSAGRPVGVGRCIGFAVVMAQVRRPVPFRTRKLRPGAAMVLHSRGCGRVARRRIHMLGVPVELRLREPPFLFVVPARRPEPIARGAGRLVLFPVGSVCFGLPKGIFVVLQRLLVNRYFFRNVLLTRYMIRFSEYGLWNGIGKDGNDVPEHRSAACTM